MKFRNIKFKKIAFYFVAVFIALYITSAIVIFQYSKRYSEEKQDMAIVLGASAKFDTPSPVFRERLNHAAYLYKKGIVNFILVTGGRTEHSEIAESYIGKEYLLNIGVDEDDIYCEIHSANTLGNIYFSMTVMQSYGFRNALLVSDPLHMKRSMFLAEEMGLKVKPSPTQTSMYRSRSSKIKFLLSESFFFMASYLMKPFIEKYILE